MKPILALSLLLFAACASAQQPSQAADPHMQTALRVLSQTPLFDGHNDLPWAIRTDRTAPFDVAAYDLRGRTPGHTDIDRLRQGRVGAQFWSVYIPGEYADSGFARVQLEQIDIARRVIEKYPDHFTWALTADDVERAFAEGKIGSVLGLEGGHAIENSLGALRAYYDLGARYMTLTHNVTLDWVDSCCSPARHGGLTRFGEEVVREMNRLGMLVDVSHLAEKGFWDVISLTSQPIIASHSNAKALCGHVRNLTDAQLLAIRDNGGVIGINYYPAFLKDGGQATSEDIIRHIDYLAALIGCDHIGLGSDFDGIPTWPQDVAGVENVALIFEALARHNYSQKEIEQIAGLNFMRLAAGLGVIRD